jgi:hypothetical protein
VEDHGDFILGPVSPKEYKDTVVELKGSRTNHVFEFFKITAPERVSFAKHREADERKAAALAAAEADTGETATSPHAGGAPSKKITKKTALAAAAEGKARKKRGSRPTDSPSTAKRTCVVDAETGIVGSVIAVVPLCVAAPSAGAGGKEGGPQLILLSLKEKTAMFTSCPQSTKLLAVEAPQPSATKPLATKASPARHPPAHQVLPLRTLICPPPLRRRVPKKTTLSMKPKRRGRRKRTTLRVATTT